MRPRKLTEADELELLACVELHTQNSYKKLCARFGISRSTLHVAVTRARATLQKRSTGNNAKCPDWGAYERRR